MSVVDMVYAALIHFVENVAEVRFAIHSYPFNSGHDAANHTLLFRGIGVRKLGLGIDIQRVQIRQ